MSVSAAAYNGRMQRTRPAAGLRNSCPVGRYSPGRQFPDKPSAAVIPSSLRVPCYPVQGSLAYGLGTGRER
jgi:hypothetical protein